MRAGKLERYPEKRRTQACQRDALPRQPMNGPSKTAGENPPGRGDQEQDAPSARYREAAVNGENRRDPWHRRQDEKKTVKKSAPKRHARPCAKQSKEENPDTNPAIDIEIETGIGERKRCAGHAADHQPQRPR